MLSCCCRAYFVAVAVSGVFAVTFSIVFAYVADCTTEQDRSSAYGLVCRWHADKCANFLSLSLPPSLPPSLPHSLSLSLTHSHNQVSATFAASLVVSPSLGTWIDSHQHGQSQVILLATMIATFNLFFIIFMVPESLPERSRRASWGSPITWEQADPFSVSSVTVTCCPPLVVSS